MQIAIPVGLVRAALRFAAKKDIRYYLNGVLIEYGTAGARIVATNGHIMIAARVDATATEAGSIIVPREALETALKLNGKAGALLVEFAEAKTSDDDARNIRIWTGPTTQTVVVVEIVGRFPTWRRVIPASTSGELANYNPDYLAAVYAAVHDVTGSKYARWPGIAYNGTGGALVTLSDDAQAVVMPLNDTEGQADAHAWVQASLMAEETATA